MRIKVQVITFESKYSRLHLMIIISTWMKRVVSAATIERPNRRFRVAESDQEDIIFRVVHHEFPPQVWTVSSEYFCKVLRQLRENFQLKWPELCQAGNCFSNIRLCLLWVHWKCASFLPTTQSLLPVPSTPCDFSLFPQKVEAEGVLGAVCRCTQRLPQRERRLKLCDSTLCN